jgi:hypothetical protein
VIALAMFAAATAQAGPLKVFRDWTVGCDNGRVCEAVSLVPASKDDAWIMHVRRGPAGDAAPTISLELEEGAAVAGLAADGRKLPVRFVLRGGTAEVDPAGIPTVIAALRSARRMEALDSSGRAEGDVAMAGASAALLYMDDRQQRVGTATALARPGSNTAAAVPSPPLWPTVPATVPARTPPRAMPAREASRWRDELCGDEPDKSGRVVAVHRLDAAHTLADVPASCLSGEYNDASLLLVAGEAGPWSVAPIEGLPSKKDQDLSDSVSFRVAWDARSGILETAMNGRGLGDCGVREHYVWDGARFRRVDRWEMEECRGAKAWIRTYHAEATRP